MSFFNRLGKKINQLASELTVPESIREDLQRGQQALEAGDPSAAEALLVRAAELAPDHGQAWHLLGLSLLEQARHTEAADSLARAAARCPDDSEILVALGEARRLAGEADGAREAYKLALGCRIDESLLERVYTGLGKIYLERAEVDRAVRELRKAVAISEGTDLDVVGLLGLAQHRGGELALARHSLSRAAAAPRPSREVLLRLIDVLLELGQADEAELAARRLLQIDDRDAGARCALARCTLARGDPHAAHQHLLRSLDSDPQRFEAHRLLARVSSAAHDPSAARGHLRTTLTLAAPTPAARLEALRELVRLELEEGAPGLEAAARALLAAAPDDPLGLAGLSLSGAPGAGAGEPLSLASRSLAAAETYAGRLSLGQARLQGGELDQAAAALRTALRLEPLGAHARRLLVQTYQRQAGHDPAAAETDAGEIAFYPLLRRVHRLVNQPRLSDLSPEVNRIREVFDRPLLITVMGEFNSGKSTFVNALIGEEMAPMGVTPTTATINILKYGERRSARVLYRDDREEMLKWEDVGTFLGRLDNQEARTIRLVELLYPAEELLRVNIIDTPGLNSMFDEHEQTAREYMGQADAVIWLFSAGQAGKQTEQQALELLHRHRLKTVGVLNKIDRLSPAELEQVMGHLEKEFSGLVETVVPVSARRALRGLVEDDEDLLAESRFPGLRQFLERQLFARSRRIKEETGGMRLAELLETGEQRIQALLSRADSALVDLERLTAATRDELSADLISIERGKLQQALEEVYRRGGDEVLDFVRPRRWVLGEHRASPADRDFMLDLLLAGLRGLTDESFSRLAGRLSRTCSRLSQGARDAIAAGAVELEPWLASLGQLEHERLSLLREQVYTRYNAFARGVLGGGRVDHFFQSVLPSLKLESDQICAALMKDAVDLDAELLTPLTRWFEQVAASLLGQLDQLQQEVELNRLEQDQRLLAPLIRFQRQLGALRSPGASQ